MYLIISLNTNANISCSNEKEKAAVTPYLKKLHDTMHNFNFFKPAGIYASHRFRGAFVGKACKNWNFMDRFSSFFCIILFSSIAKPTQIFKLKFELEENL